jgi:alkylation response protein AidB-like acyl-CoA dehydrogenase
MGPSFELGETHKLISASARDFAIQYIAPYVMDWDEHQFFPKKLFHQAGEMGFMGILVPETYGGAGLGYFEYAAIIEEISKVDPSIGLSIAAHNSLCTNHILTFGDESQKQRWLPKLATGEWIGAWGLTEHNTGSDAGGMNATAVQDGDDWIINGTKNFITHGSSGDIAVIVVRTAEKGDSRGMTAFVVERGTPGFYAGKKRK